jgi:hypothetical protein
MEKRTKLAGGRWIGPLSAVLALVVVLGWSGEARAGHPSPIVLRDATGNAIVPTTDVTPYSPKQTCGGCHAYYDEITKAYHFQLGRDEIAGWASTEQPWTVSPGMYGRW